MLLGNGIADHSNMIYMTCGVQQKLWPKPFILSEVACIDTDDQVSTMETTIHFCHSNLKFIHDKMGSPFPHPPRPGEKCGGARKLPGPDPFGLVWFGLMAWLTRGLGG